MQKKKLETLFCGDLHLQISQLHTVTNVFTHIILRKIYLHITQTISPSTTINIRQSLADGCPTTTLIEALKVWLTFLAAL